MSLDDSDTLENKGMTVIDGSQGEGGGQIFRTSLTLAMCLGIPVKIIHIRAGRKKPGLLRQHLVCLRAAQQICDAKITGGELGSSHVTFVPNKIRSGDYRFAIGSAGSTTLVLQTVLLPLLMADSESSLTIEGGTHNGMAPSFDFIAYCFLPVIKKMGCCVDLQLEKYGFYPAGGGAFSAKIKPVKGINALTLMARGDLVNHVAVATSSGIPEHVTQRELNYIQAKCLWPKECLQQNIVSSVGPGNIVSARVQMAHITEVFESIGERNVSAERVAGKVVRDMKCYLAAGVPVGEYLADQLILPMALGQGGCFKTLKPSLHLRTNVALVQKLTRCHIELIELNENCWQVTVKGINRR